jgi:uncharacterized protein YjbI with pentapeptide repeats
MSDSITALTTFALTGISDARALKTYNGTGLSSTGSASNSNPRNFIADQVFLSAAARQFISTSATFFPARETGIDALTKGATSFHEADLSGASFIGQILDGAIFSNSILKDVNFVGASLRGAIFSASLVEGARFNQADLSGANLIGAQGLTFSQVQGALTDADTQLPTGIGNTILGTTPR